MSSSNTVLIVGAGYTGLATAIYLIDRGYKVYLIEKSNNLGGLGKVVSLSNKKLCESISENCTELVNKYFSKEKNGLKLSNFVESFNIN